MEKLILEIEGKVGKYNFSLAVEPRSGDATAKIDLIRKEIKVSVGERVVKKALMALNDGLRALNQKLEEKA